MIRNSFYKRLPWQPCATKIPERIFENYLFQKKFYFMLNNFLLR